PPLTVQLDEQQAMRTRRHLRRIRQHHAAQNAADVKTDFPQDALEKSILLKAVAAASGGDQLIRDVLIVQMDFSRQHHIDILKRNSAVVLQMQRTQGVDIRLHWLMPVDTGEISTQKWG